MRKYSIIILLSILISSCISSRRIRNSHSKGNYISWHGKHKKKYEKSGFTN